MRIENNYSCTHSKKDFLKYLLVKASPVIAGVKPATLLRISNCNKAEQFKHYNSFCIYQEEIVHSLDLEYMVMKKNDNDIQVLFYESGFMKRTLVSPEASQLLNECGYANFKSVIFSLHELRSRFCNLNFPHEIGVFLGYPVKDVRGFITQNQPSVAVDKGLWRVFGEPGESLSLMRKYRLAEEIGRRISSTCHDLESCIVQLKELSKMTFNCPQVLQS